MAKTLVPQDAITSKIFLVRGHKVMLDKDLAELYGVESKRLNEQVKRNIDRFPKKFRFQITEEEDKSLSFQNKTLKIHKEDERADGQEDFLKNQNWYVFNANYGTSEEKAFVEMFERRYKYLKPDFKDIYLIRNERVVKIFNFKDGQAFEPDFILVAKQKQKKQIIYQVFIEPKGSGFIPKDKWKEDFLKEIREDKKSIKILTDKYMITGVPFYNNANENEFNKTLEEVLQE